MASALRLFLRVVEAEQRKNGAFEFINWLWNQKANAPLAECTLTKRVDDGASTDVPYQVRYDFAVDRAAFQGVAFNGAARATSGG